MSTTASSVSDHMPSGSASAIVAGVARGYHMLKIDGYSQIKKEVPNGEHIKSCPFTAGGCRWHIDYYPNGRLVHNADYMSVYLVLDDDVVEAVKAQFKFSIWNRESSCTFNFVTHSSFGCERFIERGILEMPEHLKHDCFTLRCDITVMTGIRTEEMEVTRLSTPAVAVPPPELHDHFGDLLRTKEGADVTFQVGARTFPVHRCVLAARSPVFKAQLFGPMEETTKGVISIDDMEAEVFEMLLHFLYTDSLPEMNEQEEAVTVMVQHLLVAADRYYIERLILLCEGQLCNRIDRSTVTTTLALAGQHGCSKLKEVCLEFLLHSRKNLKAAMATDGFEHLIVSCPSVVKELISRLAGL